MAFNSGEYSYCDITVFMLGRPVIGLRGIKYKTAQEKEVIHASGNEPRGFGYGNKTYEGEITLLQSELQALERAAGAGNDIVDIHNANITVAYVPKQGGAITTDIIEFIEFTESEKGMQQNDKFGEISLPFIALNIKKGV